MLISKSWAAKLDRKLVKDLRNYNINEKFQEVSCGWESILYDNYMIQ